MTSKRWQDWTNGILGLWMFASPWILGFAAGNGPAARSAWILGLAIILFAGIAVYMYKTWEEALNIILGLCLVASPWALKYTDQVRPMTNSVVIGLLVTIFAVWAMTKDTTVQRWLHEHRVTH